MASEFFTPTIIISNEAHRFIIATQMEALGIQSGGHILEPVGRNTAPATIVAALHISRVDEMGQMLVMPADHHIGDLERFHQIIRTASKAADSGRLVTFGIKPSGPETGFGYIQAGDPTGIEGVYDVSAFVEKPLRAKAEEMLSQGGYYWNSGIFLFPVKQLLEEAKSHCPEILEACQESLSLAREDLDFIRLDQTAFEACPSDSIDYAIMEKTDRAATIPSDFGWSDIGSWAALWEVGEKDEANNTIVGDVIALDTQSCLIKSENMLVATLGVKDLIIVQTKDAVLVANKREVQKVKEIVDALKDLNRSEFEFHKRVYRPWGFYEGVDEGERHQVKHICVNPGAALSLQYHHKRAEHWVVVKGTAEVIVGEEQKTLRENESVYIPIEARHRLANPADEPLHIIEVQTGSYLGEDDIVRLEDVYGRIEDK